jgi:hypothetical protein
MKSSLLAALFVLAAAGPGVAQPKPALAAPAILVDSYLALREVAFSTKPEDVEVQARPGEEQAYGVIVEYWRGAQVVTVVAFASGDSSVYLSVGGGHIGGRREPPVASAAKSLVAQAQALLSDLPVTTQYPAPTPGQATVYALTTKGLRGVQADEPRIAAAADPLNPLYAGARQIVSAFDAAKP